jgi:hypothetical protein
MLYALLNPLPPQVLNNKEHKKSTVFSVNQQKTKKTNSGALVRQRIIPTERPPLVGEVSANFSG